MKKTKALPKNERMLDRLNEAVINSLGQGFFVFDRSGICMPIHSKACESLLLCDPSGARVGDVLRIPAEGRDDFDFWVGFLFEGSMDFEDAADLGPRTFAHPDGLHVVLQYKPMRSEDGSLEGVVVVATDKTEEREAQRKVVEKQKYAELVLKLTRDRNQFFRFVKKAREAVAYLEHMYMRAPESIDLAEILRMVHTVKGGAAIFGLNDLRDLAHTLEDSLESFRGKDIKQCHEELLKRVCTYGNALDAEINLFMAFHQDILGDHFEKEGYTRVVSVDELYEFARCFDQISDPAELRRKFFEDIVSIPISGPLREFETSVHDLATRQQKKLGPIQFEGHDLRIVPQFYEDIFSSLVHVFNNSVDHGLETPEERARAAKPLQGTITISVQQLEAQGKPRIRIRIQDDGRGIDPSAIREMLKKSGKAEQARAESDEQIIQHVFDGGFSTSEAVTEVSGRGVGLSAVKQAVENAGGTVRVISAPGKGACFELLLPYLWQDEAHSRAPVRKAS